MKPFRRTLVVKLLGRQPSYGFMVKKLKQIWERKGQIDIFDLENDFYLVNFQKMDDYMEALTGGPWVISDAYLSVARWKPEFSPKQERTASIVAWVRFPDLLAPLFDKKFLLNLGNSIGKAIRLDVHTAKRTRGRFARMCVELDLTKPLIPQFKVEGQILSVVYESLGHICNRCGRVGHTKEGCEVFHRKLNEESMGVDEAGGKGISTGENESDKGLWKTVSRALRPRRKETEPQNKPAGSRFSVLQEEKEEEEVLPVNNTGQDRVSKGVVSEQKLGKAVEKNQSKKGGNEGSKGRATENSMNLVKNKGRADHEYATERVTTLRNGAATTRVGNGRMVLTEVLPGHINKVVAVESRPQPDVKQKIQPTYKENLHPGEGMVAELLVDEGGSQASHIEEDDVECTVGADMSMEEFLVWNSRGAASKGVASVIRDIKFRHKLDMIVQLEPRISGMLKSWGFRCSVRQEAEGFSGGIWILWNAEELVVDVRIMNEQFIHCKLSLGGTEMLLTAVYASPMETKRAQLWEVLYNLACEVSEPWILAGDFNDIRTPMEQQGGGRVSETRCHRFNDWIEDCNLIDIEAQGPLFTWKGPKWEGLERVYKRLDRCLCSYSWQEKFEEDEISVLLRVVSDHHPLLIKLYSDQKGKRQRYFKYEAMWKMHELFDSVLEANWQRNGEIPANLTELQLENTADNAICLNAARVNNLAFSTLGDGLSQVIWWCISEIDEAGALLVVQFVITLNSVPPMEDEIVAGGIGCNFVSRDILEATGIDDALSVRNC
ncbi:hypothetical protein K1719_020649 [Acacia pycnantha]|nr:hypothetical protein K1719_020649 [Acacia pycnantha]